MERLGLSFVDNFLQFLVILGSADLKPNSNETQKYAFYDASVELCKSHWRHGWALKYNKSERCTVLQNLTARMELALIT